jgi:pimeloyl-ACP methyl ester carboxylesterase
MKISSLSPLVTSVIGVLAVALTGCTTDATIKERIPSFKPLLSTAAVSGTKSITPASKAEAMIREALGHLRENPLVALGENMEAARVALTQLQANPNDPVALHDYNFAVARMVGIIKANKLDPWSKPLEVPTSNGTVLLTNKRDPRPMWNPALYDFTPADEFTIGGDYVKEHVTRPGIGAPVVAVGKKLNTEWRSNYLTKRIYYGVTAVARFQGNRCILSFEDPLEKETISLNGKSMNLAADFTVPLAVMLASGGPQVPKLSRMLFPEKYAETAHLARLEPYSPNKAVVLVIHGLMDSPSTWAPMIIRLRSDPEIRRNYQFWFYSYPSGYPYPYSAALLREKLDDVERRYPTRRPMLVIGHSMGGCISRLLLTDTGENLWRLLFNGKSPAETKLPASSKKIYTDAIVFKHRPEVGRVIFIAAPLKGSEIATISLGRIGSMLIRTPGALLRAGNDALKVGTFQSDDLKLKRAPNSIDTLSPKNRFVKAINKIPIVPGIPYHTIQGDRGRGDTPNSSDGVVPYWSSHMEGAKSECIVPSDHSAHQNPKAFDEVARILKLNAEKN